MHQTGSITRPRTKPTHAKAIRSLRSRFRISATRPALIAITWDTKGRQIRSPKTNATTDAGRCTPTAGVQESSAGPGLFSAAAAAPPPVAAPGARGKASSDGTAAARGVCTQYRQFPHRTDTCSPSSTTCLHRGQVTVISQAVHQDRSQRKTTNRDLNTLVELQANDRMQRIPVTSMWKRGAAAAVRSGRDVRAYTATQKIVDGALAGLWFRPNAGMCGRTNPYSLNAKTGAVAYAQN